MASRGALQIFTTITAATILAGALLDPDQRRRAAEFVCVRAERRYLEPGRGSRLWVELPEAA